MKKILSLLLFIIPVTLFAQLTPVMYSDTVSLTSSEVAALFTTPKTLVAAPGAGKVIILQKLVVVATFHTTRFVSSGTTNVIYGSTFSTNSVNACTPITAVNTQVTVLQSPVNGLSSSGITRQPSQLENQPLSLVQTKAITGSGDTTLKVYILYQIIDL